MELGQGLIVASLEVDLGVHRYRASERQPNAIVGELGGRQESLPMFRGHTSSLLETYGEEASERTIGRR